MAYFRQLNRGHLLNCEIDFRDYCKMTSLTAVQIAGIFGINFVTVIRRIFNANLITISLKIRLSLSKNYFPLFEKWE